MKLSLRWIPMVGGCLGAYLASIGLALLIAFLLSRLAEEVLNSRRLVIVGACALIIVHNVGYLWTKKEHQFQVRAAPTRSLIQFIVAHPENSGRICLQGFPYTLPVAQSVVRLMTHRSPYTITNACPSWLPKATVLTYDPRSGKMRPVPTD